MGVFLNWKSKETFGNVWFVLDFGNLRIQKAAH